MPNLTQRKPFLNLAALFEGGLVAVAFALGWMVGIDPLTNLQLDWPGLVWGIIGVLPLLLLFWISYRFPFGPFRSIKRFLIEMLGPPLSACRWYDLPLLSLLIGLSEEVLFRGLAQPWFEQWGSATGLIGSNAIFGLAHAITPAYALLAGLIGSYLGLLLDVGESRNLLPPIVTHALYDYVAFLAVIHSYRQQRPGD